MNGWTLENDRLNAAVWGGLISMTLEDEEQYERTIRQVDQQIRREGKEEEFMTGGYPDGPRLMATVKLSFQGDIMAVLRIGPEDGLPSGTTISELAAMRSPEQAAEDILAIARKEIEGLS